MFVLYNKKLRHGNQPRTWPVVGRNDGRKAAHGDYLFFLDDDNTVRPDTLTELLKVFADHPRVGLVAIRNRRPDIAWAYLRGTLAGIFGLY